MSDHYCCKACGQRYDKCRCSDQTPKEATSAKLSHWLKPRVIAMTVVGIDKIEKRYQEWLRKERQLMLDPKNLHGAQYNAWLIAFRAGYAARDKVESGKKRARS